MNKFNGFADFEENQFLGERPHELSVCITTGNLGDIRRFPVASREDALAKCKELNVRPNFGDSESRKQAE